MALGVPWLYVVLPAYDEAGNLRALISSLEETLGILGKWGYGRTYVVVDDGSRDATPAILREHQESLPMTVLTHPVNQGLGAAIRDGLIEASRQAEGDDIILTMDADNTHPPGTIVGMTQRMLEGSDLVIASRYRPGSRVVGVSRLRRLMSFGARVLFQAAFPIPGVRDYTSGFRAYRARLVQDAVRTYGDSFVEHSGFQTMVDILLKVARLGPVITEVPLILRYDRKAGESKMPVGGTALGTLSLLVRRRLQWWGKRRRA